MFREYRDKHHWSIIPLKQDGSKRPAVKWEEYQYHKPSDADLAAWEAQVGNELAEPQIAIITGAVSNLVVLDLDSDKAWESIKGLPMPVTVQAWTTDADPTAAVNKRGKAHFYFQHPGPDFIVKNGVKIKALGGADVRGDGGYVVAPPSRHAPDLKIRPRRTSGWDYEWAAGHGPAEVAVAPLPGWLKDKLTIYRRGEPDPGGGGGVSVAISDTDLLPPDNDLHWLGAAFMGVSEGARDDTATKIAGYFLGMKLPKDHVVAILTAWNTRNDPGSHPFGLKEIKKIVRSIAAAESRKPPLVQIDPALPLKEQRPGMLDVINQTLELTDGNRIERIQKYKGEAPDYTFIFVSGAEAIMSPEQLLSQGRARVAFLGQADKVIPRIGSKKDPNAWDNLVSLVDKTAEIVNVGRDATQKGALADAIERYLASNPPDLVTAKDSAPEDEPFIYNANVHLFIHSLNKYLYMSQFQRMTIQMLARNLKSLGWSTINLRFGEKRCRAWQAPRSYQAPLKGKVEPLSTSSPDKIIPFPAAEAGQD